LMFNWRNETLVRQNSFSQETIEFDGHQAWYQKKLMDPNSLIFIASINGKDMGQIRFDKNSAGEFEIDFSIDKNFRGKGLGNFIIINGIKELLKKRNDVHRLVGKVKKDNLPSQTSFLHSGFKLVDDAVNNSSFFLYYFDNE
jgi:RimJ/RimL family protein N-acetyltransferase